AGQLAGIVVGELDTVRALPDEDPQRQLDADTRVALHEQRPRLGVAEDHDELLSELQSGLARGGGVVEAGEHGQPALLDRGEEPFDSGDVIRRAARYD